MLSPAPRTLRSATVAVVPALLLLAVHVVVKAVTHGSVAVDDAAQLAAATLAAVGCTVRAVRSAGPLRRAWSALALGCAAWAAGQATWTGYELVLHRPTPFPSPADVAYLLFPVGAVAGIALFPTGRPRQRGRDVLDGAILAASLLTISWTTGIGPALAGDQGPFETAVSLAYPLSDVALVTTALLGLSRAARHRTPLLLVAAGLTAMAAADTLFSWQTARGTYATGNWTSTAWVAAFLLLAAAATAGRDDAGAPARRPAESWALAALPYVPLTLTLAVAAVDVLDGRVRRPAAVFLLVATGLTLARQHLTLRDNRALLGRVASQQSALEHQAFHDPLTGLPNRARFVAALEAALGGDPARTTDRRQERPADDGTSRVAVLFCDLDGFKGVNDGLGHAAGDALLAGIARRLTDAVGGAGLVARLGGDEFAVLLVEPAADPLDVAHRLRDAADAPFRMDGRLVRLGASVGVAAAPPGPDAPSADLLLGRADVAMYTSKRSAGRRPVAWSPGLALPEAQDWKILPALEHALATGTLLAHYQPVVSLRTGEVRGYEALARWPHEREALSPAEFLPVAARNGLMRPLTLHMFSTAARQHARWLAALAAAGATGRLSMSVNVSPADFVDPQLPDLLAPVLAGLGLPPGAVVVEVTEDALLTDVTAATRNAAALHDLGLLVALDDFGAGYSALAHLTELPLDVLKLDRHFVREADTSAAARTLLRGVVGLARDLGLTVVAEGVEREAQAEVLRDLGCPLAQGFLYAPARSAAFVDPVAALTR